jgi:hypothetical protein
MTTVAAPPPCTTTACATSCPEVHIVVQVAFSLKAKASQSASEALSAKLAVVLAVQSSGQLQSGLLVAAAADLAGAIGPSGNVSANGINCDTNSASFAISVVVGASFAACGALDSLQGQANQACLSNTDSYLRSAFASDDIDSVVLLGASTGSLTAAPAGASSVSASSGSSICVIGDSCAITAVVIAVPVLVTGLVGFAAYRYWKRSDARSVQPDEDSASEQDHQPVPQADDSHEMYRA